jgi:two-component system, NarL family, response regulator NreC
MPIRCLVVDDHTLFRAGLRRLLESEEDFTVIGEAGNASEALERVGELRPDVVLMDIGMPGMSSFEAAQLIGDRWPGTRLIFLTMYEDQEYLTRCLASGAAGYVLKDVPAHQLIRAVREVHAGRKFFARKLVEIVDEGHRPLSRGKLRDSLALTPRERQIMAMIAEGMSVRQTAGRLSLSVKTVEAHKFNLMRKLDLHNRAQLVTYAIRNKIVKVPAET